VLLGEHRHAEGERVHAGEHLPAGTQHACDLGDKIFRGQPQGERALLGDHAIGAAVGEELEAGPVGGHGGEPAACLIGRDGRGDRHLRVDDAQHAVPGAGGHLGGARTWPRYVDEESAPARQPAGELGEGDGGVKTRVVGGRTDVLLGPSAGLSDILALPSDMRAGGRPSGG
jgi:hypothetical protein